MDHETDCDPYEELIAELADEGALDANKQEALRSHLASCPSCRALEAELIATVATLRSLPSEEPPPQIVESVFQSLKQQGWLGEQPSSFGERFKRRRFKTWAAIGGGALAAAAVMGIVAVNFDRHDDLIARQRGAGAEDSKEPFELAVSIVAHQLEKRAAAGSGDESSRVPVGAKIDGERRYGVEVSLSRPLQISIIYIGVNGNIAHVVHSDSAAALSQMHSAETREFPIELLPNDDHGPSGELRVIVVAATQPLVVADAALCERYPCLCSADGVCSNPPPASLQAGAGPPMVESESRIHQRAEPNGIALLQFPLQVKP